MTVNDRHVPAALVDYSEKCVQDLKDYSFINTIAPGKKVQKESDVFYTYVLNQQFRDYNTERAMRTQSKRIDLTDLSQSTYQLKEYALNVAISDRERANADPAVNPEYDAIEEVTNALLREKAGKVASTFWTDTSFSVNHLSLTSNVSGGQYNVNTSTSSPIDDADTARNAILQNTAKEMNFALLGPSTRDILCRHADILDRIKWSERGIITNDLLAAVLNLEKVEVANTIHRTTNEGISATTAYLFDDRILYGYNETSPKLRSGNLGITFIGAGDSSAPQIRRWRDEAIESDVVELKWLYDVKLVQSLSGYLISDTQA